MIRDLEVALILGRVEILTTLETQADDVHVL